MKRDDHLLVILAEEASEIIKDSTKALRFGIDDCHPVTKETNRDRLVCELNDFIAMIEMLQTEGMLPLDVFDRVKIQAKKEKVERYLRYSQELGRLNETV